jgi:hypothetical protein
MKTLALLTATILLAGCGSAAEREASAPAPPAPAQEAAFLVRPEGPRGPLVGYAMPAGTKRFELPPGLASADGTRFYAVAGGTLQAYDPATGERLATAPVGPGRAVGGVSPTGRWVALARRHEARTEIEVVDGETGAPAHILRLDGDFEVETISADGESLFLVEHVADGRYVVRLYDLEHEALVADPLRAKTESEVMTGLAWSGLATPEGGWLLTLYLDTSLSTAFVHALDLERPFAYCIPLPSESGDFERLKRYSLTLAGDGRTVYAANPSLGVVAKVNLRDLSAAAVARFDPPAETVASREAPRPASVFSPAEDALYFSAGPEIWRYDAASGAVSRVLAAEASVTGLGVGPGGAWLDIATVVGSPARVAPP